MSPKTNHLTTYLPIDPSSLSLSIDCKSGRYVGMAIYGSLALFVYSLGIPLSYSFLCGSTATT